MRDYIDPEPRHIASADSTVEQFDIVRNFLEQRTQGLIEKLKPRHVSIPQIDDDARAFGGFDARLTNSILQRMTACGLGLRIVFLGFPHTANLTTPASQARKKA